MLAKLSNITLAFGASWMSLTIQLRVIYNLLLATYTQFWIRLTIRPPPELHRFSNALSTLHKVSLLVRQIALTDLVLVTAKLVFRIVMLNLLEIMSLTLPS